mmetsp:Transcript_21745/g.64816  ORF Transcript_21745/g.64816 Transcript_21745/m.64816 type:complete len:273 (+) Transcript_21745:984-1802(+)
MKPGRSDCRAALSCTPAFCDICCRACERTNWAHDPTCWGCGCDRQRTPVALLWWLGFAMISVALGPQRWLWTNSSTADFWAVPSNARSSGSCGTPRLSSMRWSISLSASAWMVFLPALCSFIIVMTVGRSRRRTPLPVAWPRAPARSKSEFIAKLRAASSHGLMSRALSAGGTSNIGLGSSTATGPLAACRGRAESAGRPHACSGGGIAPAARGPGEGEWASMWTQCTRGQGACIGIACIFRCTLASRGDGTPASGTGTCAIRAETGLDDLA